MRELVSWLLNSSSHLIKEPLQAEKPPGWWPLSQVFI